MSFLAFLAPIAFFILGAYLIYQVAIKGLKGVLFGGKVSKSYGEVTLAKRGTMNYLVGVHGIATDHGGRVGMQVIRKSGLSFEQMAVTLTKSEAQELAQLLSTAASET